MIAQAAVGCNRWFGGYATVENSGRYTARPDTDAILSWSSTNSMNASAGTSHSHVIPRSPAGVNPNLG
jgi:hypothetical protein